MTAFYADRDYRLAWTSDLRSAAEIDAFLAMLESVDREGLNPENFHAAALKRLLAKVRRAGSPGTRADLDILLTDAYFTLGRQLAGVRLDPSALHEKWLAASKGEDPLTILHGALSAGDDPLRTLAMLRPTDPAYRALCDALARYRDLEAVDAWRPLPNGSTLHQGDQGPAVAWVRERLTCEEPGVFLVAGPPSIYDADLARAVRRFQKRHGLETDGIVGAATWTALNVTPAERATQIVLNLERRRWSCARSDTRFIRVNIPDFRLGVIDDGDEVLSMRAVVGRRDRPTPVLSGRVTYLEINPFWNIPQKLARRDVLPHILKDPDYLAERDIRVYETWCPDSRELQPDTLDWGAIEPWNLAFKLRQEPGPKNPLGRIKFMFANPFSVYIHDTPGRAKFEEIERCFSSGCVRVEDPFALATFLLSDDDAATCDSLLTVIETGRNSRIGLPCPVPVHLDYETAWVDGDGVVQFREDVYGYDAPLGMALAVLRSGNEILPGPDGTRIEVHEPGAGVVADAAGVQAEGGAAQVVVGDARQAYVDRLACEMETLAGRLVSGAAEHLVGVRGAVSRNDLEGLAGVAAPRQVVQLVEQGRVDGPDLAGPVVAQEPVDGGQTVGEVGPSHPIDAAQALARVDVLQGQGALDRLRGGGEGPDGPDQ